LYQQNLHEEGENQDTNEDPIIEEVLKYVVFVSKFSAVNLVEDLHEHKGLENYSIDDGLVNRGLFSGSWGV
jgi:hypothetical protein